MCKTLCADLHRAILSTVGLCVFVVSLIDSERRLGSYRARALIHAAIICSLGII